MKNSREPGCSSQRVNGNDVTYDDEEEPRAGLQFATVEEPAHDGQRFGRSLRLAHEQERLAQHGLGVGAVGVEPIAAVEAHLVDVDVPRSVCGRGQLPVIVIHHHAHKFSKKRSVISFLGH